MLINGCSTYFFCISAYYTTTSETANIEDNISAHNRSYTLEADLKRGVLASHKTRFNPPSFFLKMSCCKLYTTVAFILDFRMTEGNALTMRGKHRNNRTLKCNKNTFST